MTDQWTFAYVTDMQPGSPKSFRFNPAWQENWECARQQIIKAAPELIIIGGDVTRDGSIHQWELEAMKADFDSLAIPYHAIPGNMDTGNKHADHQGPRDSRDDRSLNITHKHLQNWQTVFGDWKWSFDYKNVRFSGFCDMLVNSGLPEESELWSWLNDQANKELPVHHLWFMHYPLFIESPDETNWDISAPDQYLKWYFSIDQPGRGRLFELFKQTGTTRVVTGHVHCQHDSVFEGINFESAPATCDTQFTDIWPEGKGKQGFYLYDVDGEQMSRRFVPLERVSTRTDKYGPGGHPLPEARDYSIAWEK